MVEETRAAPGDVAGYIYLVTNLLNGKGYFGQTRSTLDHRWTQHLVGARTTRSALHCAIRKYGGANFRIELLETVRRTREDLLQAEIEAISRHGSPSYAAKRDASLRGAAEKRAHDAVERDKAFPPEVAAQRTRRRASARRRAAAGRAKVGK
jgi:hypothetical protein